MKTISPYKDRVEAGRAIASRLTGYSEEDPVVVGLPRGGVVVAAEIARTNGWDLDIIVAGKLRAPGNPELAIGAVTEKGLVYLNEEAIRSLSVSSDYIEGEKEERLKGVREKLALYRKVKPRVPLEGRTVIITDDGLATGSTMISAVQAASASKARSVVVAVPGGPVETVKLISGMKEVREVVCPDVPPFFYAVSQLYMDFQQVEDAEVVEILKEFK